jgi:mannose/fructose/N-acetylgalactosamine-specific phosphotransferase system component IID
MLAVLFVVLPALVAVALWLLGDGKRWSPLLAAVAVSTTQVAVGYTHESTKALNIGLLASWFVLPPLLAGVGASIPSTGDALRRALVFLGLYLVFALLVPPLALWLEVWTK